MAVVVVSDASPIRALHHLGLLWLSPKLYGSVIVPASVEQELRQPSGKLVAIEIEFWPGFEVRTPRRYPSELGVPADLDPGETEAIALAIELRAALLLIDERKGTRAARQLGLPTLGVLGVLLEAKRHGLIQEVLPCADRLVVELRFFLSPTVRRRLAELARE